MAKRTKRIHSAVFTVNVALAVMAGIMLDPKRWPVARTIRGLSCRGIAHTRDVIASQRHLVDLVGLEVALHRHERHHDPIFSRSQECRCRERPRVAAACLRATETRQ
jgi:hypothetical protein